MPLRVSHIFTAVAFVAAIVIIVTTAGREIGGLPTAPLSVAGKFVGFAACMIAFWHGVFFRLIFATDKEAPNRVLVFRSIDYVWYVVAVASAVWAVNGLAIKAAENDLAAFAQMKPSEEFLPQGPRFKESCAQFLSLEESDWALRVRTKEQVKEVCTVRSALRRGVFPFTRFMEVCKTTTLDQTPKFPDFVEPHDPPTDEDIFGSPGFMALTTISQVCADVANYLRFQKQFADFQADIARSKDYPGQNSNLWIYFLATVIGLRLTKTSQECVDARRSAKKISDENAGLKTAMPL